MKLTKSTVEKLPVPDAGQAIYRDDELKGFALRITPSGRKTFVVEKRIGRGSPKRKTLGSFGELTAEQARKQAIAFLGKIASGEDPIAQARDEQARAVTLRQAFELYLKTRQLKPNTVHDYRRAMKETFEDWMDRPLAAITKDQVAQRHKRRGAVSPARADNAMRVLQAVFNFARWQFEDSEGRSFFPENPVSRLSHTRGWYRVGRRRTLISASQLPAWFEAVEALRADDTDPQSTSVADLLLLCLFTGLRRSEALTLKWTDVDFVDRVLTIQDTKNHEPLRLPLSSFLYDLLHSRWEAAETAKDAVKRGAQDTKTLLLVSPFVFPGKSQHGHLTEPRTQIRKVTERSGVTFTLHDLRRTFITVAEGLDISLYAIKRLVNHKMKDDVTAGYVVPNMERLRAPMEAISRALCQAAGIKPPSDTHSPSKAALRAV